MAECTLCRRKSILGALPNLKAYQTLRRRRVAGAAGASRTLQQVRCYVQLHWPVGCRHGTSRLGGLRQNQISRLTRAVSLMCAV